MNHPKASDLWTPPLRQVAKKCRLRPISGTKEPHVWEVNAGWDVRLDGAAVIMTSVTGIPLDKGARRPGAFGGLKLRFA
jgi:hypothetical protein